MAQISEIHQNAHAVFTHRDPCFEHLTFLGTQQWLQAQNRCRKFSRLMCGVLALDYHFLDTILLAIRNTQQYNENVACMHRSLTLQHCQG